MPMTQNELVAFLATQTAEQRVQFAELILNFNPTDTHKSPMGPSSKSAPVKLGKTPKIGVQPSGLVRPAKRPLNSWMAYRCLYATIFFSYQQKEISGYLTLMWKEDPFKAKWTLVAKAYSIIRDQVGKALAPLDLFLQIVCPVVGIVMPAEYLDKLGWMKTGTEMVRRFVPDVNLFDAHLRTTNLSADDIVRHCQEAGYIASELKTNTVHASKASLTMTAEPKVGSSTQKLVTPTGSSAINVAEWFIEPGNTVYTNASGAQMNEHYNDQFEPEGRAASLDLLFEPNGGDQFNAFDIGNFIDTNGLWQV
ncbi:hypothetical protein EJ08DRAFT_608333 [Tothia fuscella]|uniref:Mating-type protein MAT-1 n=1 Tax=Tothia fuscella TaxID=1048955 RepID=A0A9P4NVD6_9PEZI|nr:hypothetical protein EJ08DRAFT_608333 [Tothia fuscella]